MSVYEFGRASNCKKRIPSKMGGLSARICDRKRREEILKIKACKEGM